MPVLLLSSAPLVSVSADPSVSVVRPVAMSRELAVDGLPKAASIANRTLLLAVDENPPAYSPEVRGLIPLAK